jgi:hypothetical protein
LKQQNIKGHLFTDVFAPPPIDAPPGSCSHHSDFPLLPATLEWVELLAFDPGEATPIFLTTVDKPELTPFLPPPGNIVGEFFVLRFFFAAVVLGLGTLTLLVDSSSKSDSDCGFDSASDANSASMDVLFEVAGAEEVDTTLRVG